MYRNNNNLLFKKKLLKINHPTYREIKEKISNE